MKHVSLWTVIKLRVQLWRIFGFDRWKKPNVGNRGVIGHHRLSIRWNGRFQTWMWICLVESEVFHPGEATVKNIGEYNLGTLYQWTLEEALSLAARKAEWVLHPDQEPRIEPQPNPPTPTHAKVYRLMDSGQFRVECKCGWIGNSRCHGETNAPEWCQPCARAEQSYGYHKMAIEHVETVSK